MLGTVLVTHTLHSVNHVMLEFRLRYFGHNKVDHFWHGRIIINIFQATYTKMPCFTVCYIPVPFVLVVLTLTVFDLLYVLLVLLSLNTDVFKSLTGDFLDNAVKELSSKPKQESSMPLVDIWVVRWLETFDGICVDTGSVVATGVDVCIGIVIGVGNGDTNTPLSTNDDPNCRLDLQRIVCPLFSMGDKSLILILDLDPMVMFVDKSWSAVFCDFLCD